MFRFKLYIILFQIALSFEYNKAQSISNYVTNGSFEDHYTCLGFNPIVMVKGWRSIDSSQFSNALYNHPCFSNIPWDGGGYQYPRTGEAYVAAGFYCPPPTCSNNSSRGYFRNRLKNTLIKNQTYCVKYFVNVRDISSHGINQASAYFCGDEIDTITEIAVPLTYLNPQINFPINQFISDTVLWTMVTGTFTANGTEKHILIGNFKSDAATDTVLINSSSLPMVGTDLFLEDVSCIPLNLAAYAGPDKSCKIGDSVYVGRERDFAIDPGCTWFQLPNMSVPIATASGIWVKPTVTTTYVVKQVLDCSALKYDTVVVYADLVGLPGVSSSGVENDIRFFPNPTRNKITFEYKDELQLQTINIKNILGQQVLQFIEPKKEIDVSFLSTGIYYLRVETNKGSKTFKLQKE
jgi:hypothetical protein